MIIWVTGVLRGTVVGDWHCDNLCGSHLQGKSGAVYKVKCSNCQATFFGEADRNLTMWLSKHTQATKKGGLNNNIAEHHLKTSHTIDWDSAMCFYNLQYWLLSANYTQKLIH